MKKCEEEVVSIKANHLPAIYSILAYLYLQINTITIKGFLITPIIGMLIVYILVSIIYYKDVLAYSKNLLKNVIGLKS